MGHSYIQIEGARQRIAYAAQAGLNEMIGVSRFYLFFLVNLYLLDIEIA